MTHLHTVKCQRQFYSIRFKRDTAEIRFIYQAAGEHAVKMREPAAEFAAALLETVTSLC